MFSLRKRAKLENELKKFNNKSSYLQNELRFDNLPVEIYHYIFDFLGCKELLKLRLINNFFKNLIDNGRYLWNNFAIRVEIKSSFNSQSFWNFFLSKPHLKCLK